jgi:hypothetical protein
MTRHFFKTAIVAMLCVASRAIETSFAQDAFFAQAGFNDASGINSNATPNSPYTIGGPVNGAGLGEPGWNGAWFGSGLVQNTTTFEGDGAVQITPTSAMGRVLSAPQMGRVLIEEHVQFAPGADLVAYTDERSVTFNPSLHAAIWQVHADNKFYVIDGLGNGGSPTPQATGFTWLPNTWYTIDLDVNMVSQTWTFAVNGVPYVPPHPLGFRGNPTFMNDFNFLSEGSGAVFVDAITVVPEPSSLVLAAFGLVALLAWRWRRLNRPA